MEAGQSFIWTDWEQAFVDLKSTLFGNAVMAYSKFDDKGGIFIVDCVSSNYAVGGCLSQMQWCYKIGCEIERPIMFASKTLDKSQKQYCTTRKELLAMVTFVQQFKMCLLGHQFIIRSGNASLHWLMRFISPTDQLARWLEVLSPFEFVLLHRSGKTHRNADIWSRVGCDPYACDCYDRSKALEEHPCGGCKTCKKRQDRWAVLDDVDDVVPLFARPVSCRRPLLSGDRKFPYVGIILSLVTVLFGCRGAISGKVQNVVQAPLLSGANVEDISRKNMTSCESPLDDDLLRNGSSLNELKTSPLASYNPEQIREMQNSDPDIGILIKWRLNSSERPCRDFVAGESPYVRH